jgi:DNA transposition AAA+ family ATPase
MTEQRSNDNTVAPLRNVAALAALINRIDKRSFGLPGLGVFYGPSGFGKSYAGTYATNKFGAIHIEIKSVWRHKTLCEAIAHEMGIKPAPTIAGMVKQISQYLLEENVPLLIDEADVLVKRNLIEVVRDIYEGSGATVVLIGEEGLPQSLRPFERIHNRILDWVMAEATDLADARHLVALYAPGLTLSEDLIAALIEETSGTARRIVVNLDRIRELAVVKGLKKVTLAEFPANRFYTGEAPEIRRFTGRLRAVK